MKQDFIAFIGCFYLTTEKRGTESTDNSYQFR